MAREPLENGFHLLLYRAAYSLALPADEIGSVKLNRREKRPRH
jgi:hypothetical protein